MAVVMEVVKVNNSLPPHVKGPRQGTLDIHCQGIRWDNPKLHQSPYYISLSWWGNEDGAGLEARLPSTEQEEYTNKVLSFALRSSRRQVIRYLQDAGYASCIILRDEESGKVPYACGHLDLSGLIDSGNCYETISLQCTSTGKLLGHVQLQLDMTFLDSKGRKPSSLKSDVGAEEALPAQVVTSLPNEHEPCMVVVTVNSAILNHMRPINNQESMFAVYASVSIRGRRVDRQFTRTTSCYFVSPMVGYTAVWERQDITVQIPDDITYEFCEDTERNCAPILVIHLWQSAVNLMMQQNNEAREIKRPDPFDTLIGCAVVNTHDIILASTEYSDGAVELTKLMIVNSKQEDVGILKVGLSGNEKYFASRMTAEEKILGESKGKDKSEETSEKLEVSDREVDQEVAVGGLLENLKLGNVMSPQRVSNNRKDKEEVVRYAWSGSDSDDDGLDAVGIAFQGAVSCSDEEPVEDANTFQPTGRLITEDWLYDISKSSIKADDLQNIAGNKETLATGKESCKATVRRPVIFKNTLLPGLVQSVQSVQSAQSEDTCSSGQQTHQTGRDVCLENVALEEDFPEIKQTGPFPSTPLPPPAGCDQYSSMDTRVGGSFSGKGVKSPTFEQVMLQINQKIEQSHYGFGSK